MLLLPRSRDGLAPGALGRLMLVIDRQTLFLAALSRLLREPPLEAIVSVRTRSDQGLRLALHGGVDLILCDLRARPVSGPAVATILSRTSVKVVLLADPEDKGALIDSLTCGAVGFFTKEASPDDLQEGLIAVLGGHYVIGSGLAPAALARLAGGRDQHEATALDSLTTTQRIILVLAGQGEKLASIAKLLGLAESTVRTHFSRVCRLLELHSQPDVVRFTARTGMIPASSARREAVAAGGLPSPVRLGPDG
jgi:DNA-binding NarL/FixJ family response regulator